MNMHSIITKSFHRQEIVRKKGFGNFGSTFIKQFTGSRKKCYWAVEQKTNSYVSYPDRNLLLPILFLCLRFFFSIQQMKTLTQAIQMHGFDIDHYNSIAKLDGCFVCAPVPSNSSPSQGANYILLNPHKKPQK